MAFRKRKPPAVRKPHPDGRVEADLQRIISLRRSVARKEEQIVLDQDEIRKLRRKARDSAGYVSGDVAQEQAAELRKEIRELETAIVQTHDEIAKRIDSLNDSDLAWLDG